jgi:DNA-binding winged helix-turn-helix (wHTH) protein
MPAELRDSDGPASKHGRPRARGLFEGFPRGLILVGEKRRVVSLNRKAHELLALDERHGEPGALTCCELVCNAIDRLPTDAGAGCVTRWVLDTGQALPEMEIEVEGPGAALTVSASRVDAEDVRVMLELRPGTGRRGGAVGGAGPNAEIRIRTLGRFQVEGQGRDLGREWLDQRPGRLLKYLACERHEVATSERIAEALWPSATPHEALTSLRHYVHVLRERLEPGRPRRAASSYITTHRGGYRLNTERVWVDADELERHALEGLRLHRAGRDEPAGAPLEAAVLLYEGEFLPSEHDSEWALEERERLHHLVARGARGARRAQAGGRGPRLGGPPLASPGRPGAPRHRGAAAVHRALPQAGAPQRRGPALRAASQADAAGVRLRAGFSLSDLSG